MRAIFLMRSLFPPPSLHPCLLLIVDETGNETWNWLMVGGVEDLEERDDLLR